MKKKRDFLTLTDLTRDEHYQLFARAAQLKADRRAGGRHQTLAGKTLCLILEKASTRTKLSFEAGMAQLGGHTVTLQAAESQIARGEPVCDTARVAASYADVIAYRTFGDERLHEMAKFSSVPVINALSEGGHPVQLLADLMTMLERLGGDLRGKRVAWIGDSASNMARSWIEAANVFELLLTVAAPNGYRPPAELLTGNYVRVVDSPAAAVDGADVVTTDVWASMGQEKETAARKAAFAEGGYTVDGALLARAKPHAIVLHCLPAHRGEEITGDVIDSPQSAIFDEAENRMHVQKALLEKLLGS